MNKALKIYVRHVDAMSLRIGNVAKFLILAMIGVLAFEAISRNFFNSSHIWSLEITEYINVTYYLLGGAYTLLIGGHVRMDVFYTNWSAKKKAIFDIITFVFGLIFLVMLIYGGSKSVIYSLKYNQVAYSAWAPPVAPIKIISVIGIVLMLLQNIAEFIKDLAIARGKDTSWIRKIGDRS
jgi:TRAP-type mannitol/chloroaromatic compound transport system permease small subunit